MPWTWVAPWRIGGQGVGDGELAVVVGVDADRDGEGPLDRLDGLGDPFGEGPAVGVAEDQPVRPGGDGGLQGLEGVVGVPAVAVEEVLGVVDDLGDPAGAEGDRVGDHPAVLFERDAEDLGHLEIPALADDRDRPGRPKPTRAFIPVSSSAAMSLRRVIPKAVTLAWARSRSRTARK